MVCAVRCRQQTLQSGGLDSAPEAAGEMLSSEIPSAKLGQLVQLTA